MTNQNDGMPTIVIAFHFAVDLADQGTGRIDINHFPRLGGSRNRFWNAMGGKNHGSVGRCLVKFLNKDRALAFQ